MTIHHFWHHKSLANDNARDPCYHLRRGTGNRQKATNVSFPEKHDHWLSSHECQHFWNIRICAMLTCCSGENVSWMDEKNSFDDPTWKLRGPTQLVPEVNIGYNGCSGPISELPLISWPSIQWSYQMCLQLDSAVSPVAHEPLEKRPGDCIHADSQSLQTMSSVYTAVSTMGACQLEKQVAFSDESHFQFNRMNGHWCIRQGTSENKRATATVDRTQAGGSSVMVWRMLSWICCCLWRKFSTDMITYQSSLIR